MLSCFKYSNKKVRNISFSNISVIKDTFFLDVSNPNDSELKQISKLTKISITDLRYSLRDHAKTELMNKKGYSMFTFKRTVGHGTSSIGIFISRRFVIALHKKKSVTISRLVKNPKIEELGSWFGKGTVYFTYKVLLEMMRQYSKEVLEISDHVEEIESEIFASGNFGEELKRLFYHKKSLMFYRDALIKNRDVIEDLQEGSSSYINGKDKLLFGGLKSEVVEVIGILDMVMKSSQDTIDVAIGMEANKLNDIMRSFTVIASFVLIPTLISGIWGMNFANIPFFDNAYGFYIPLLLMVLSIIFLLMFFKAKKWM